MVIFKKINDIKEYVSSQRSNGARIGFVPTMGALHAGHVSLVENSGKNNLITICSIFVNPTQFNDKKDLEKYPVSTEADIELLVNAGCSVLFLPEVNEMYPEGDEVRSYDFGYLDTIMEGAKRPGHFRGVGQIVSKLLEIMTPDALYLGQKDYQQCMVIKKLVEIMGMNELEVVICPTMREEDGLAMSSRNRRLSEPERTIATTIYQCLVSIQAKQGIDSFEKIRNECADLLTAKGFSPEYVALADANDLTLLDDYQPGKAMVALIAAGIGGVRLIDNLLL